MRDPVAIRRLIAVTILAALAAAGCGGSGPQPLRPVAQPAPRPGVNQAGPSVQIGAGNGAAGPWRAWVYQSNDGMFCLEYEDGGGGGSTCGSEDAVIEPSVSKTDRVVYLMGGTQQRDAAGIVAHLMSGQVRHVPLVAAGPLSTLGAKYFFVLLPIDSDVRGIDVVDGSGKVLETKPLANR